MKARMGTTAPGVGNFDRAGFGSPVASDAAILLDPVTGAVTAGGRAVTIGSADITDRPGWPPRGPALDLGTWASSVWIVATNVIWRSDEADLWIRSHTNRANGRHEEAGTDVAKWLRTRHRRRARDDLEPWAARTPGADSGPGVIICHWPPSEGNRHVLTSGSGRREARCPRDGGPGRHDGRAG